MTFKNSSLLLLLITSWVGLSCLLPVSRGNDDFVNPCIPAKQNPHPFLCGEKMALSQAKPADFALIDGISLALGRKLADFVNLNPQANIQDLDDIKGVGEKTLEKIQANFF